MSLRRIGLPDELIDHILDHLGVGPDSQRHTWTSTTTSSIPYNHPALSPPPNGSYPFLALPTEVRRAIFATSLPARDTIVQPRCDDEHGPKSAADKYAEPRHNRTTDLMVLHSRTCDEVATVLYEERAFAIHVHEGIAHGGIEFLNAGRQPLQYKDALEDRRFLKFKQGEIFGFDRLKKICIDVYPCDETNRLVSINTYYMNLALVALLERSYAEDARKKITSLTISFASRTADVETQRGGRAIANAELYWWDVGKDQPRETSIHGTSNIQLVLLPFSRLRCHNVHIHLPHRLASHAGTTAFVDLLVETMTGDTLADMMDDGLLHQLEAARAAYYDEHVLYTLYGNKDKNRFDVPKLSEADMLEEQPGETQYELSSTKRRESDDDEDEELQAVLLKSAQEIRERPRPSIRSSPPMLGSSFRSQGNGVLARIAQMPGHSFTGLGRTLSDVGQASRDSFAGQGRTLGGTRSEPTHMSSAFGARHTDRRGEDAATPGRRLLASLPRLDDGARDAGDGVGKSQWWASSASK